MKHLKEVELVDTFFNSKVTSVMMKSTQDNTLIRSFFADDPMVFASSHILAGREVPEEIFNIFNYKR